MQDIKSMIPFSEVEPSARLLMARFAAYDRGGSPFRAFMQQDAQSVFGVDDRDAEALSYAGVDVIIERMLAKKDDTLSTALGKIACIAGTDSARELVDSVTELIYENKGSRHIFLDILCTEAMRNVSIEGV